jgi:RNA 3'-terminal phosphate cyclase-like protein
MDVIMHGITGEEGRDMTVSFTILGKAAKADGQVDMIRTVTLPHLHLFGITDGLELQVSFIYPNVSS